MRTSEDVASSCFDAKSFTGLKVKERLCEGCVQIRTTRASAELGIFSPADTKEQPCVQILRKTTVNHAAFFVTRSAIPGMIFKVILECGNKYLFKNIDFCL